MTTARKGPRLTPEQWRRARGLFESALELPDTARRAWLTVQCGDDAAVRAEAEQLLAAAAADSVLDTPVGVLPPLPADDRPASLAGRRLGPWQVLEPIGRGGMGEVWLAERADGAYEQRVAIKLLKRGLDTDVILDRFLRERRILARLSHPHIARLIDAGATDEGRPYLVMEHIDGEPVTDWCRSRELDLPRRLALFEQICEAVHAAHRQQIVHRDLKPSNVLVARDGEVKLLDFGIAKLVGENDVTQTQFGSTPATLHYGAPEQLLGQPVTTASDVYSLGVILYELLTGHLPHRHTSLALALHAAANEHLSTTRPSLAIRQGARRDIVAEARAKQIEGEVDWIVLKALQRDPARRYRSAAELADDVRRFLDHRPVLARPDSFLYRAGRFVRRHRLGVAAAVITVLSLLTGLSVALWQAQRAVHEAHRAEQVKQFLVSMFHQSSPLASQRKEVSARELLDRGAAQITGQLGDDPLTQAELYEAVAEIELGIFDPAKALEYAELSLDLRQRYLPSGDPLIADVLVVHGDALRQRQQFGHAEGAADEVLTRAAAELREADQLYAKAPGDHRLQRANALKRLAQVTSDLGHEDQALALHEQALALYSAALGADAPDTLNEKVSHADELALNGHREEAVRDLNAAIAGLIKARGPLHTDVAMAEDRLSRTLADMGRDAESEQAMSRAIEINSQVLGDKDELVATEHVHRALQRANRGRFDEADADFAAARPLMRPGSYPDAQYHDFHSMRFALQQRYAEAAEEMRLASADYRAVTSKGETQPWAAQSDQGFYTALAGNAIAGERLIRESIAHIAEIASEQTGDMGDSRRNLGYVLAKRGELEASIEELRTYQRLYHEFVSKDFNEDIAESDSQIASNLLDSDADPARIAEAQALAQRALKVLQSSRDPETVAKAFLVAARADRLAGDNARAVTEFGDAARTMRDTLPSSDRPLDANSIIPSVHRHLLARALAALDDGAAAGLFDEAVAGIQRAAPDHYLLGNVLLDRARWRLAHGDRAGAQRDQTSAIAALQKNQGADSVYLRQARSLLSGPSGAGA